MSCFLIKQIQYIKTNVFREFGIKAKFVVVKNIYKTACVLRKNVVLVQFIVLPFIWERKINLPFFPSKSILLWVLLLHVWKKYFLLINKTKLLIKAAFAVYVKDCHWDNWTYELQLETYAPHIWYVMLMLCSLYFVQCCRNWNHRACRQL